MVSYSEKWLTGPQKTKFYTRTYSATAPKAVFVVIHGFIEHIGRYTDLHTKLSGEHDITVFAYDLRGYGKTAQDKENKSATSVYGKTAWAHQMEDIEWALGHAKQELPNLPLFLMGHSMGGGQVLGFATHEANSPYYSVAKSLSGVIAASPCIHLAKPPSKIVRWIGGKAGLILPNKLIPAEVKPEQLSRNPEVGKAFLADPLVRAEGSLRALDDMLSYGEALVQTRFKQWPKSLPVLLIHGTADLVTSHKATKDFHSKVDADHKHLHLFEGCYHELPNDVDDAKDVLQEFVNKLVEFVAQYGTTAVVKPAEDAESAAPPAVTEATSTSIAAPATTSTDLPAKSNL